MSLLFGLILNKVDLDQFRTAIKIRHFGAFFLGVACILGVPVVMAFRLGHVASTPGRDLVRCLFRSNFFNNFLPAQIGGDVYKVYELEKHASGKTRAVAAVFGDRLIGVTALVGLSLTCVVLGSDYFTDQRVWYALEAYFGLIALLYALVFLFPMEWLERLGASPLLAEWVERIKLGRGYVRGIISSRLLLGLGLSLVGYGLVILMNVFFMVALGLHLDPLACMVYVPVISIGVVTLPISFNGLGVRESLFILFFPMAGYSLEQSLSLGLLNLLGMLTVSGVGGILLLGGKGASNKTAR